MAKNKEKTLNQIKRDINKAEEGKKEVLETYESIAEEPNRIWPMRDWIMLFIVLLLFAFAIVERSRVLSFVAGVLLIVVVIKMYATYIKR